MLLCVLIGRPQWDYPRRYATLGTAGGAVDCAAGRASAAGCATDGIADTRQSLADWRHGLRGEGNLRGLGGPTLAVAPLLAQQMAPPIAPSFAQLLPPAWRAADSAADRAVGHASAASCAAKGITDTQ